MLFRILHLSLSFCFIQSRQGAKLFSNFDLKKSVPKLMASWGPSERISTTDNPCIVEMERMLDGKEGLIPLSQGIVFWTPPEEALVM